MISETILTGPGDCLEVSVKGIMINPDKLCGQ